MKCKREIQVKHEKFLTLEVARDGWFREGVKHDIQEQRLTLEVARDGWFREGVKPHRGYVQTIFIVLAVTVLESTVTLQD